MWSEFPESINNYNFFLNNFLSFHDLKILDLFFVLGSFLFLSFLGNIFNDDSCTLLRFGSLNSLGN